MLTSPAENPEIHASIHFDYSSESGRPHSAGRGTEEHTQDHPAGVIDQVRPTARVDEHESGTTSYADSNT